MRTLVAAVLVGMALAFFAKAALACNDDAYKPQNKPEVHQNEPVTHGT